MPDPTRPPIDWEGFYRSYRKPGYVPGFEILHKIGGGAFGLVFKARKESIDKDYAIKFLKVDDEGVRDAMVRELGSVRYFAQIDHPNLVSIEDRGEVDGIPYIVMGYAGDSTLRERLRSGPLPRPDAIALFQQIARGVQALHEHSLVHFDLKPGNVFLKGDLVRVGDYGLSRLVTQSRNSLSFGRGTPYYMAPEVLQRRGDHRSDIYSLGVLLYECLLGDVPFRGDSEWEVLRKHERETPDLPETLTDSERQTIARCLAKDPTARFANVADLLATLCPQPRPAPPLPPRRTSHIGAARPPRAAPRLPASRRSRGHRHRQRLVGAACVGFLVALVTAQFSSGGYHHRGFRPSPTPTAIAVPAPVRIPALPRTSSPDRPDLIPEAVGRHMIGLPDWRSRLRQLASTQLRSIARAVERAELSGRLDDALRDTARDLERELRRMDPAAIEHTLDRLADVIDELLAETDRRQAPGR